MLHLRIPLYEKAACHVVDTSALNMEEVAASIMEALPEGWQ
jgi:regulator of PEP synthase PpsR (kinase-PPPase family)